MIGRRIQCLMVATALALVFLPSVAFAKQHIAGTGLTRRQPSAVSRSKSRARS